MLSWLIFDVGIALLPLLFGWLTFFLINRPFPGWLMVLRDGQLCFFAVSLAAVAAKDVIQLGRPVALKETLDDLGRLLDSAREGASCKTVKTLLDVGSAQLEPCLKPPPDASVIAILLLILVLVMASFVFGVAVANSAATATSSMASPIASGSGAHARLASMSILIALLAVILVGGVRFRMGV